MNISKKLKKIGYYNILSERLKASFVNIRDGRASEYIYGLNGDLSYRAQINKEVTYIINEILELNEELFGRRYLNGRHS